MENIADRNDYSVGASQAAQANFERAASDLEAALDRRDADVRQAMSDYLAEGVSDRYAAMERQWYAAGNSTRDMINTLRTSMANNDDVAIRAIAQAGSHIPI